MDRALGYGPRGCGFDSRRVHENVIKWQNKNAKPCKSTDIQGFFISNTRQDKPYNRHIARAEVL